MMVNGKVIKFYVLSLKGSQRINARSLMDQHVPLGHLQWLSALPQPYFTSPSPPCVRVQVRVRAHASLSPGTLTNECQARYHRAGFSKCTILPTSKTCECPEGGRQKPQRAQENSGGDRPRVRRPPAKAHQLCSRGRSVSFPPGSVSSPRTKF